MEPIDPLPIDHEKNRQILADRCGWPDGALDACREIEARFPAWHCWWTDSPWRADGQVPDGPCFGADRVKHARAGGALYAVTPDEVAQMIKEADERDGRERPWRYRP